MGPLGGLFDSCVRMSSGQRALHAYLVGGPGMGKTTTIKSWVVQDVQAGQGLAVLDPHDDLYNDLVLLIAQQTLKEAELAERVVLVDPTDPKWTVGFNPLEPIPGIPRERQAAAMTDVVVKIAKEDATAAPRTMRLLTHSFVLLSEHNLTLVDLPRFLSDRAFREGLLKSSTHPEVVDYFRYEFPAKDAATQQWITPVLNRIGRLIFDPALRLMLGSKSTINFRQILDRNLILLVNLSKGILGEGNSALLAAFFVAHIQQAAMSRANCSNRSLFVLYTDEFQNYSTDNVKDILSEMRKYGLSLVLAHQFLDQLTSDIRGAVLNTTGTIVCFRVGYDDAKVLAREIFPPGFLKKTTQQVSFRRQAGYRLPYLQEETKELAWEKVAALLTELRPREFWSRRRGPFPPIKQRSLPMPELKLTPELLEARRNLINISGAKYGRLKTELRKEIEHARSAKPPCADADTTFYEAL